MALPEKKVTVDVLKNGRWAQEAWLPQLVVAIGDKVNISLSIAIRLQKKGNCTIRSEQTEATHGKRKNKTAKQIKKKSENNPPKSDKKAAEG